MLKLFNMSVLDREIPRRKFLAGSAKAAGAVGAAFVISGCEGFFDGKPVFEERANAEPEIKITRAWGDYEPLVRKDASLSSNDEFGYTKPGIGVIATEGSGVGYPNSEGLSGQWYKVKEVPIYEKIGDEYFPVVEDGKQKVAKDAVLAASFLRDPSDEELSRIIELSQAASNLSAGD